MMRCPQCGRVFTDDALRFCLYDGQPLAPGGPAVPKRGGPRGVFVWAVFGVLGAVLGLIVLLAFVRAGLTVAARARQSGRPAAPPSGLPSGPDPRAAIAETIRRADDAESLSFRTLDSAPLFPCYAGDALQRELAEVQSLRQRGVFNDGRLLSQRFGAFALAPDGSEAQVEVSETWSVTVYSLATRRPVQSLDAHVVPQSVHLRRAAGGWVVDHVMAESASSP